MKNGKRPGTLLRPGAHWNAPLRYADDLSCFVERLLLLRTRITAGVPFIGVACCPVVRSKQYRGTCDRTALGQEDRNSEIRNGRWNLEGTTPAGRIKTMRVVQPISGSLGEWLPDRLRQPDYLPPGSVPKDEGRRLSALRPYLAAGLPLSVQSNTGKNKLTSRARAAALGKQD